MYHGASTPGVGSVSKLHHSASLGLLDEPLKTLHLRFVERAIELEPTDAAPGPHEAAQKGQVSQVQDTFNSLLHEGCGLYPRTVTRNIVQRNFKGLRERLEEHFDVSSNTRAPATSETTKGFRNSHGRKISLLDLYGWLHPAFETMAVIKSLSDEVISARHLQRFDYLARHRRCHCTAPD